MPVDLQFLLHTRWDYPEAPVVAHLRFIKNSLQQKSTHIHTHTFTHTHIDFV